MIGQDGNLHAKISGFSANTKQLYNICTTSAQRRRRWDDVVQMLYKCFVFAGLGPIFYENGPMLGERICFQHGDKELSGMARCWEMRMVSGDREHSRMAQFRGNHMFTGERDQ